MRYEDTVRKICGDNWKTVNKEERDGGYGVAIMIAFLRGCRPSISELANHLEVEHDEIVAPYTRLSYNGVFYRDWGAKNDAGLLGESPDWHDHEIAWSHIAAVSGGLIGIY